MSDAMIPSQRVASKKRTTNGVVVGVDEEEKNQLRKVSSFVMSLIEAASGSGSCSSSSCPTSPSPPQSKRTTASSSQKSFEVVVESALGSLGSLSSSLLLPTLKEEDEGKSNEKDEELRKRRRRRRKKSSLKPLTPQDLGHLRITEGDEKEEQLGQDQDDDDHLSSFHLRNPIHIPIFVQLEDRPIMAFNVDQQEVEVEENPISIQSSGTTLLAEDKEAEIEEATVEKGDVAEEIEIISRDCKDDKLNSNSEREPKVEGDCESKNPQDEQLVVSSADQNLREIGDGSLLNHLDHDDVDIDRHLRVDHYHHHSHHHYYHLNHHLLEQHQQQHEEKKSGVVEKLEHLHDNRDNDPLFLTQVHNENDEHEVLNSPHLCPTCPSIPDENIGDSLTFPLPHDLNDLSFYSRFSATTRQKAILSNSNLNPCSNPNPLQDSLQKRLKSRSTPINLDVIAMKSSSSRHGCPYCSFPCTCCCDECCCARQLSHSSSTSPQPPQPPQPPHPPGEEQDEEEFITKKKSSSFSGKPIGVLEKSMRSRSMETFTFENHDDNDYSDGDIDHQDFLTASHLLNHHMPILRHGCHLTPTTNSTLNLHSDTDDDEDDVSHEKKHVSSIDFLSGPTKIEIGEEKKKNNAVVQSSMQQTTSSSTLSSVARRDTQLVIIRKKPSLSARDGDGEDSTPQQRQRQSQLRVANGEIRSTSSPISNSIRKGDENEREVGARMTVRMDTMSLFLDAVHLQMD
ncbi:unnamed protein product [Orchesella dallaii]|uniref:Uncharacterized protein n=1 Tax=Orchesella dallaii TaxID=48710 RepID=A0ABP1R1E5_9HEXA